MIVAKTFYFNSAHQLPEYEGKCKNLHGHRWKLVVEIEGKINPYTKMVLDFNDLKEFVNIRIIDKLDHHYLNDIIENPTAEMILLWIREELKDLLPNLKRLRLYETPDSYAELEVKKR